MFQNHTLVFVTYKANVVDVLFGLCVVHRAVVHIQENLVYVAGLYT